MQDDILKARIAEADRALTAAEDDLTTAMNALQRGPRSDTTIITEALDDALVKLKAARA